MNRKTISLVGIAAVGAAAILLMAGTGHAQTATPEPTPMHVDPPPTIFPTATLMHVDPPPPRYFYFVPQFHVSHD